MTNNNNLLIESVSNPVQIITESYVDSQGIAQKNCFIEGIFLQADLQNKNGRVYPKQVVENAVRDYTNNYIATGRSLGELGHPENPQINLHLASHLITELRQEGSNWIGKAKILDTPMGRIAKTLIESGVKLGVSLRGLGTTRKQNGQTIVESNFRLTTVDIVADPSAPQAFVSGFMESTNDMYNQGLLLESDYSYLMESVEKFKPINEKVLLENFEKFLRNKEI